MSESNGSEHSNPLAVECSYFERERDNLLLKYPNRVLLIRGEEVLGNFANENDAVFEGVRKFGSEPFLVRRSGAKPLTLEAPALTLGILKCRQS